MNHFCDYSKLHNYWQVVFLTGILNSAFRTKMKCADMNVAVTFYLCE